MALLSQRVVYKGKTVRALWLIPGGILGYHPVGKENLTFQGANDEYLAGSCSVRRCTGFGSLLEFQILQRSERA
jgi:hypothetical protein